MCRPAYYFPKSGNKQRMSSHQSGYMVKCHRKEGDRMDIRQKIERILDALPEYKLKRIYELVKYIFICT